MADYSSDIASAYNDIKEAGGEVTISHPASDGVYNPVTETRTGGTAASTDETYAVSKGYKEKHIDGTIVRQGDKMFLIPALLPTGDALAVDQADKVIQGGTSWNIVNIEEVGPDGTAILYKVQARQ